MIKDILETILSGIVLLVVSIFSREPKSPHPFKYIKTPITKPDGSIWT